MIAIFKMHSIIILHCLSSRFDLEIVKFRNRVWFETVEEIHENDNNKNCKKLDSDKNPFGKAPIDFIIYLAKLLKTKLKA